MQLLEPFIDVLLPLGQFLQPVENGELFALLCFLLLFGFALLFVAFLLRLEFEFIELRLHALLALAFAPALILHDAILVCRELEQRVVGRLFCRQRGGQGSGGLLRRLELRERFLHLGLGVFEKTLRFRILGLGLQFLRLLDRLGLRSAHRGFVFQILARRLGWVRISRLGALQIPRRGHDHFLQLGQLGRLAGAALLRLAFAAIALAIDLFERPYLGEEKIGGRAARLAIRAGIFGPDEVGNQLVRCEPERFQWEQKLALLALVGLGRLAEFDLLFRLSGYRVGEAVAAQAEVIPYLRPEAHFLQRRHAHIAARREQLQLRLPIRQRLDGKLRGDLVGPAVEVHELHRIDLARENGKVVQPGHGLLRIDSEGEFLAVLGHQFRGLHRFVQTEKQVGMRAFHGTDSPGVRHGLLGEARIFRVADCRIGAIHPRVFEDLDCEVARLFIAVHDAVGEVAIHFGQPGGEDRVCEVAGERNLLRRAVDRLHHEQRPLRDFFAKACRDHQPGPAFHRRIARRYLHLFFLHRRGGRCDGLVGRRARSGFLWIIHRDHQEKERDGQPRQH